MNSSNPYSYDQVDLAASPSLDPIRRDALVDVDLLQQLGGDVLEGEPAAAVSDDSALLPGATALDAK